jgi:hypothetical protein
MNKRKKHKIPVYDYMVKDGWYTYYDIKTGEVYPKIHIKENFLSKFLRLIGILS